MLTDDWAGLTVMLASFPSVRVLSPYVFRVFFRAEVTVDEANSTDQEFGRTRVFVADRRLAISVVADALSEGDVVGCLSG